MNLNIRPIYRAGSASFAAANGVLPFFSMQGVANHVIVVHYLIVAPINISASEGNGVTVVKTSAAPSGGTATPLTVVPSDSRLPATIVSTIRVYTVGPTIGTEVGNIGSRRIFLGAATSAGMEAPTFDFGPPWAHSGIYLRSASEGITAKFAVAPATAPNMLVEVGWSEMTNSPWTQTA